jgi:hypothetical protein
MDLLKDREHVVRIGTVFGAGVLAFLLVRHVLVPKGFGVYGHFRAGAIEDNRVRPLSFAGHATCEECHSDVKAAKLPGKHTGVACEACHGALGKHAQDNSIKPVRPHGREVCVVCHRINVAKPKGFPQIEPADHAGDGLCTECHSPHNPLSAPEAAQ